MLVGVRSTLVGEQLAKQFIGISSVGLEILHVVAGWIELAEVLAVFHTGRIAVAGDVVVKVVEDGIVFHARD